LPSPASAGANHVFRHCEPTGPAFRRPEDKLRDAISCQVRSRPEIAPSLSLLAMTAVD
jgi:hypothetical protein